MPGAYLAVSMMILCKVTEGHCCWSLETRYSLHIAAMSEIASLTKRLKELFTVFCVFHHKWILAVRSQIGSDIVSGISPWAVLGKEGQWMQLLVGRGSERVERHLVHRGYCYGYRFVVQTAVPFVVAASWLEIQLRETFSLYKVSEWSTTWRCDKCAIKSAPTPRDNSLLEFRNETRRSNSDIAAERWLVSDGY